MSLRRLWLLVGIGSTLQALKIGDSALVACGGRKDDGPLRPLDVVLVRALRLVGSLLRLGEVVARRQHDMALRRLVPALFQKRALLLGLGRIQLFVGGRRIV